MANRRMINTVVTDTGLFLMMPPSTQSLYFHLCTHADDDGVVDAYGVMRMTQSKEDDFAILVSKRFVTVLDKVQQLIWINHWFEHNNIRAELITPSQHRELLVSVIPGVPVKESKKDADTRRRIDARNAVRSGQNADKTRIRSESAKSPPPSIVELSESKESEEVSTGVDTGGEEREMKESWKNGAGTTLRLNMPENLRSYRFLREELGDQLEGYLAACRMIRADRYARRTLQAKLTSFNGLRDVLDQVEAYMLAHADRFQESAALVTEEEARFWNREEYPLTVAHD